MKVIAYKKNKERIFEDLAPGEFFTIENTKNLYVKTSGNKECLCNNTICFGNCMGYASAMYLSSDTIVYKVKTEKVKIEFEM